MDTTMERGFSVAALTRKPQVMLLCTDGKRKGGDCDRRDVVHQLDGPLGRSPGAVSWPWPCVPTDVLRPDHWSRLHTVCVQSPWLPSTARPEHVEEQRKLRPPLPQQRRFF